VKVCKLKPSFPSRDRSALTAALNPSAVDGTTINSSPFSWAIRLPGQDARKQARKERASLTPEIKMGVLLGRRPAGRQAIAVVPSGLSLRGPDMSLDMRLLVVSVETPGSDGSESMVVGLSGPRASERATGQANTAAYVAPPPDGPGCRLPTAACSPVTAGVAGRGADPGPVAGRLLAVSIESPELASSLVLRLPASCWETLTPLPDVVLRLPAGTAGFFLLAVASLSSLRRTGESFKVEIALIKAN